MEFPALHRSERFGGLVVMPNYSERFGGLVVKTLDSGTGGKSGASVVTGTSVMSGTLGWLSRPLTVTPVASLARVS